jgi:hypothetical protein
MAFVVMYFTGKEQQSLAICDFVHHGNHAPGASYFYPIFPNAAFCFMWLLNLCTSAKKVKIFTPTVPHPVVKGK